MLHFPFFSRVGDWTHNLERERQVLYLLSYIHSLRLDSLICFYRSVTPALLSCDCFKSLLCLWALNNRVPRCSRVSSLGTHPNLRVLQLYKLCVCMRLQRPKDISPLELEFQAVTNHLLSELELIMGLLWEPCVPSHPQATFWGRVSLCISG